MDTLAVILLIAGVGYAAFRNGKRIGSRLGFRASRRLTHHRRFR